MLQPDGVRHRRRLDMERARLQQLEAGIVERPFDLDGHAEQGLGLAQHASQRDGLAGIEARLLHQFARHRLGRGAGAVAAGVAMVLAAGRVAAQEALAGQDDAVRHHLALGDRRTEPPGGAEQHLAFGVLAQPAAGGARLDQRLDQHRHRGVAGAESVIFHVAAGVGGPQRGPACPHRGHERGLVGDAEEAFELAGEVRALAILDERRGAHRKGLRAARPRGVPGVEESAQDFRRDRLLVECEPDLDGQAALLAHVGSGVAGDSAGEAERCDLVAIGVGGEAEPAGRRQSGPRQRCEVSRLRPDALGIDRRGARQRHDEPVEP